MTQIVRQNFILCITYVIVLLSQTFSRPKLLLKLRFSESEQNLKKNTYTDLLLNVKSVWGIFPHFSVLSEYIDFMSCKPILTPSKISQKTRLSNLMWVDMGFNCKRKWVWLYSIWSFIVTLKERMFYIIFLMINCKIALNQIILQCQNLNFIMNTLRSLILVYIFDGMIPIF